MTKKPKIAMLCFSHPVDDGRVAFRESVALKKAGYRVRIIGRAGKSGIIGGQRVYGIPALAISRRYMRNMILRVFLEPFSFVRFFFICSKYSKRADVLHCHEYQSLLIALILKKFRRQIVVYDCHEFQPELFANSFFPDSSVMYVLIRRSFAWFEKFLIRRCDGIITVNDFLVERLGVVCQLTCLLPNYPSARFLSDESGQQSKIKTLKEKLNTKFVLGFAGVLSADMGVDKLISMIRFYAKQVPNVHLLLIGYGDLIRLENCVAEHGAKDLVSFTGHFRTDELRSYLELVDVGFCLTDPGCWRLAHSSATKIFQYCAAGIPSVLSDNPAHRKLLDKAEFALLVDYNDCDDIAEKVKLLASDSVLRKSMGIAAKSTFLKCWNAEAVEQNLICFYESLVEGDKGE